MRAAEEAPPAARRRIEVLREATGSVDAGGLRMAWGCWPGCPPTVVALHGITASYANFVGVAEKLAGRRELLALDLRGRGDTDKPGGPYGMVTHARDVAAAMEAFGLGPSVVVGHSMGAFVAVALAAEFPHLVAAAVLIDGGLPLEVPAALPREQVIDAVLSAQMERLRMTFGSEEEYLQFWRDLPPFSEGRWNDWVERYLRYDLGGTDGRRRPKASEMAVRQDSLDVFDADAVRARLAAVSAPVLLIRAEQGFNPGDPPILPDALVRQELSAVARITDMVVPGTTHYTIALGETGAEAVAEALVSFAEECGR